MAVGKWSLTRPKVANEIQCMLVDWHPAACQDRHNYLQGAVFEQPYSVGKCVVDVLRRYVVDGSRLWLRGRVEGLDLRVAEVSFEPKFELLTGGSDRSCADSDRVRFAVSFHVGEGREGMARRCLDLGDSWTPARKNSCESHSGGELCSSINRFDWFGYARRLLNMNYGA